MDHDEIKAMVKVTALSNDFLAEIGRITVHFALLERALVHLTHVLLALPENIARTVTSELSFRGLQHLASSLVKEKHPAMFEDFMQLLKLVGQAEDKRNRITHSSWGMSVTASAKEQKVVRTKFTAKHRGLRLGREELTVNDLRSIASNISVAAYDVDSFAAMVLRNRA